MEIVEQEFTPAMRTIDQLFEATGWTIEEVAGRSQLSEQRVEAIAMGRWTPSPAERARLAEVFSVEVEEISWGHTLDPRNLRYLRLGRRAE